MADKYVDVSATYNGDGSASNQAASAGAVGAWNTLTGVLSGTPAYGALNVGDTINIRTYAESSDLEQTLSSSLTTKVGLSGSPVIWKFDDGSIWPTGGKFTLKLASGAVTLTISNYNVWVGGLNSYEILGLASTASVYYMLYIGNTLMINPRIITPIPGTSGYGVTLWQLTNVSSTFINPYFQQNSNRVGLPFLTIGRNSVFRLVSPVIDLVGVTTGETVLFGINNYGTRVEIEGGRVVNSLSGCRIASVNVAESSSGIVATGFDPGLLSLIPYGTSEPKCSQQVLLTALPSGPYDFWSWGSNGSCSWITGDNYPYLYGSLPNGTPWSYKVYTSGTSTSTPQVLPPLLKQYTSTDAIITVTQDFLSSIDLPTPTENTHILSVCYVDTNDQKQCVCSLYGGAVEASSAGWSATIYGEKTYLKYKVSVTTPTAVKQGTHIEASLSLAVSSLSSDDYYFVDPEVSFS